MQKIKDLCDHIKDELEDAEEYIRAASMCKDRDRDVADTYCRLAEEEMSHVNLLHKQVVRVIEEYRRANGDPPPVMQARYDLLHEIHLSEANKIRMMIQLYKEG